MKSFKEYLEETPSWWNPQRRLSEPEEAKRKLKYISPTARTGSSPTPLERRAALDPGFEKASEKEGHMVRPRPDVGRDTIGLRTRKTATGKKVAKETEKLDSELPWGAWKPPSEENAHWSSPSHPLSPQSIRQRLLARRRRKR